MCAEAKGKKVSRPKIRALLQQLKSLGVDCVIFEGRECCLDKASWIEEASRLISGEISVDQYCVK